MIGRRAKVAVARVLPETSRTHVMTAAGVTDMTLDIGEGRGSRTDAASDDAVRRTGS